MDAQLELWRGSIRALSTALGVRTGYRTPATQFFHRLQAGDRKIGTVGVDLRSFLVASIWRTMFKPVGMTIVVTATKGQGEWFIAECEKLLVRNEIVRSRVWVGNDRVGLCEAGARVMHTVHVRPEGLVKLDPVGDCLIMIPNLDSIEGGYLKLASELTLVPGVSLAANAPPRPASC